VDRNPWERLIVNETEHNHAFMKGNSGVRFTRLRLGRNGDLTLSSGFKDLTVMKTTQSGFSGFIKDEYTSLKETTDRIMATKIYCEWEFGHIDMENTDFTSIHNNIHRLTIDHFAGDPHVGTYSASVQHTIYDIGMAALKLNGKIEKITFKLPNIHYYLVNFKDFVTEEVNNNEVFYTFDGAHGEIEATVERKHAKL